MRDYYEVITPAASEPLTLAEVKLFLRVDTTADDALIGSQITAARLSAEKLTNRLLQTQTLRVSYEFAHLNLCNMISRSPVNTIDSVEVWDGTSFIAFTDYFLRQNNSFPSLQYKSSPPSFTDIPFNIQVQFQAGYSTLPADLKIALKQHIAFLYENRGDTPSIGKLSVPPQSEYIYRKYRVIANYV
jgi:uncharacterized phiE125 gp8 family phage protein